MRCVDNPLSCSLFPLFSGCHHFLWHPPLGFWVISFGGEVDAISTPNWDALPYPTAPSRHLEPRFISVFPVPWFWVDHSLFNDPSNGQTWESLFITFTPACINRRAAFSCDFQLSWRAEPCILCRASHLCSTTVCFRSFL